MPKTFVAIDDTDNLESKGTGWMARQLGLKICARFNADLRGITRHQLLLHPDIPYTSHNSSACLELDFRDRVPDLLFDFACDFVSGKSAEGSDPGLCIALAGDVCDKIKEFGQSAQKIVVTKDQAIKLACETSTYLRELGGTGHGIIGALAAVGLRATGSDGRYINLAGIRELEGIVSVREIIANSGVERVVDGSGSDVPIDAQVDTLGWIRPQLYNNQPVVFVEKMNGEEDNLWQPAERSKVKKLKGIKKKSKNLR